MHVIDAAKVTRYETVCAACCIGCQSNRMCAGAEAVDLLGTALRAAHGYGGQRVPDAAVLGWESDDLATMTVLENAASTTTEPVVRLAIRDAVEWHAGTSCPPSCELSTLIERYIRPAQAMEYTSSGELGL